MAASERASSALGLALRQYLDARSTALLAARKALGINELDARALLHVLDHPGTRPSDLKTTFGLTSAGVSVLTDRLVERGALRRDPDPDDRRSVRLTATVDVASEPWSALTRFDLGFEEAVRELGDGVADDAAALIRQLAERAGAA